MSDPDCLFCKIVAGDVPSDKVRESAQTMVFRDISPQAPTHLLVIPRLHQPNAGALAAADPEALTELIAECAAVAADEGIAESGYRIVFNTGPDAQQTVAHVHAHVLGGRQLSWPPG